MPVWSHIGFKRLVDRSNLYESTMTGKLSSYFKKLKLAIPKDDRFSGDDPIEVGFLAGVQGGS
jgi:hypothetical protein